MNQIALRRRATKSLPYDAEVEYLNFNGNCFIDTGYIPKGANIRIKTKVKFVGYTDNTNWTPWFQAYTNENTGCHRFIRVNSNNTNVYAYNGAKANGGGTTIPVTLNTTYTIDMNKQVLSINDKTYNLLSPSNVLNTGVLRIGHNKVLLYYYYFQVYDNEQLIIDYNPVRIGNVGYMYDKVSGQLFGNSGTGNFILGADK